MRSLAQDRIIVSNSFFQGLEALDAPGHRLQAQVYKRV
jgi:hypothetical protein